MRIKKQKKKELSEEQLEVIDTKNFFDRIAPVSYTHLTLPTIYSV